MSAHDAAHFAGLLAAFEATARRAGGSGNLGAVGRRLLASYGEEHRAYHDFRHLGEVLARVDELAAECADVDLVRLAAWFHDVVYEPAAVRDAASNEERSARAAERELAALGLAGTAIAEVARLVRLTATHQVAPGDRNAAALCDADLAILAAPPARYQEYTDGVRREYADVPEKIFASTRAALLAKLLERPRLFLTPTAAAWEEPARANVRAEIRRLAERA